MSGIADDATPLAPRDDGYAVIVRTGTSQWGGNCDQPVLVEARWRFDRAHGGVTRILLCGPHAEVRCGRERCVQMASAGAFGGPDVRRGRRRPGAAMNSDPGLAPQLSGTRRAGA